MATTLYETGLRLCEKLHGAYAGITARPGLALETRALILIAACICRGDLPAQVKAYVEAALGLGVSRTAIIETILQTLPIAGFPAVTNAFVVAKDVLG